MNIAHQSGEREKHMMWCEVRMVQDDSWLMIWWVLYSQSSRVLFANSLLFMGVQAQLVRGGTVPAGHVGGGVAIEKWNMENVPKKNQCFKNPWFPVKIFSETNPLIHGTQHVLALGYGGVPVASASHRIFWEQVGTNSETGVGSVEGKAGHGTVSLQITIPQLQSQVTPLFASRLVTFGAGEYRTPNCGDLVYRHQKNHAPQLLPK